jgi:hypothetical protein
VSLSPEQIDIAVQALRTAQPYLVSTLFSGVIAAIVNAVVNG